MVLRQCHRIDISTVHEAHEREFRACEEFFDNHLSFSELVIQEHILERFLSLFQSLGDHNSLAGCQAVIFEHYRNRAAPDIFQSGIIVLESLECCGRDVIFRHELLREVLAGFDCCCGLGRAEYPEAGSLEGVHDAGGEGHFGADDGEVDGVFKCKGLECLHISILYGNALRLGRYSCISRCAIDLSDLRRTAQGIYDGMFTSATSDYEYFFHMYQCWIS